MKFLDQLPLKQPVEEFLRSGACSDNGNTLSQLQTLNIILGIFFRLTISIPAKSASCLSRLIRYVLSTFQVVPILNNKCKYSDRYSHLTLTAELLQGRIVFQLVTSIIPNCMSQLYSKTGCGLLPRLSGTYCHLLGNILVS